MRASSIPVRDSLRATSTLAMAFTAVIHFKTKWPHTRLSHSASGVEAGPWLSQAWESRTSPMGPFWVVTTVQFDAAGLLFSPECADSSGSDDDGPTPACTLRRGKRYFLETPGTYVLASGELTKFSDDTEFERDALGADLPVSVMRSRGPRRSFFLDIDGTLLGDGAMSSFVDLWDRRLALSGGVLAFNTGRGMASVMRFLTETASVIVPTVTVCRVGCSIFWFRASGRWLVDPSSDHCFLQVPDAQEDAAWLDGLDGSGGWETRSVLRSLRAALVADRRIGATICDPIGPVPAEQRIYVASFIVDADRVPHALKAANEAMPDTKFKTAVCGRGDSRYLDVICVGAGKLGGMRHVLKTLGPAFPAWAAVMAGDSGNDLDALEHDGEEKGIIVANCQDTLIEFWKRLMTEQPNQKRVVFTDQTCADGIVQGLRMLGFV